MNQPLYRNLDLLNDIKIWKRDIVKIKIVGD